MLTIREIDEGHKMNLQPSNAVIFSIPNLDARYTVAKEFCGYVEPRWVARFCGSFLSSHMGREMACTVAHMHNDGRTNTKEVA